MPTMRGPDSVFQYGEQTLTMKSRLLPGENAV
jgi:hypothetical protein